MISLTHFLPIFLDGGAKDSYYIGEMLRYLDNHLSSWPSENSILHLNKNQIKRERNERASYEGRDKLSLRYGKVLCLTEYQYS